MSKLSNSKESKKNKDVWRSVAVRLKEFVGSDFLPFSSVTESWLIDIQNYFLKQVSQNSANVYFAKVACVVRQGIKDKIIIHNPLSRVDNIKKTETKKEYLTIEEVQMLAKTECDLPEMKKAFLFSCLIGLRWSDLYKLQWSEISSTKNQKGKTEYRIEFRQQKTKGIEYLPISSQARELLGEPKESNGKVFSVVRIPIITEKLL